MFLVLIHALQACAVFVLQFVLTAILNEAIGLMALIGVSLYSWDLVETRSYSGYDYSQELTPEQRMDIKDWNAVMDDFNRLLNRFSTIEFQLKTGQKFLSSKAGG